VDEIEYLGHPDVRHGLINDLFDLDWRHADVERRPQHHAVLAERL